MTQFKKILFAMFTLATGPVFAGVTLMNADRQEYAISIKCKADTQALEEIIEINGLLDLDTGPCTVKLKASNQVITATDGEIIEIRQGKIGLR
jgi:hypothetical protein